MQRLDNSSGRFFFYLQSYLDENFHDHQKIILVKNNHYLSRNYLDKIEKMFFIQPIQSGLLYAEIRKFKIFIYCIQSR